MSAYTNIPNHVIDDDNLNPTTLGVLVWLLRQPTTKGLTISKIQYSLSDVGEITVSRCIHRLEELGYLKRVRVHKNGRFQTGEYVVTDRPEI